MTEHKPGWYEHQGERRYWDGTQWTHSTSLPSPVPPPGQVPPPAYGALPPAPGPSQPYGYGYGAPPPGAPPPGAMPVARKEPALSLLLSFLFPGVGSMVNGDVGAGVAFLGVFLLGALLSACLVGLPIMLGAWIWAMVHAYQGAQDFNRAVGYPG